MDNDTAQWTVYEKSKLKFKLYLRSVMILPCLN